MKLASSSVQNNSMLLKVNKDEVIKMILYDPHSTDFIHQRPDGTTYVVEVRKNNENYTYTPEKQLNLFDINYEA